MKNIFKSLFILTIFLSSKICFSVVVHGVFLYHVPTSVESCDAKGDSFTCSFGLMHITDAGKLIEFSLSDLHSYILEMRDYRECLFKFLLKVKSLHSACSREDALRELIEFADCSLIRSFVSKIWDDKNNEHNLKLILKFTLYLLSQDLRLSFLWMKEFKNLFLKDKLQSLASLRAEVDSVLENACILREKIDPFVCSIVDNDLDLEPFMIKTMISQDLKEEVVAIFKSAISELANQSIDKNKLYFVPSFDNDKLDPELFNSFFDLFKNERVSCMDDLLYLLRVKDLWDARLFDDNKKKDLLSKIFEQRDPCSDCYLASNSIRLFSDQESEDREFIVDTEQAFRARLASSFKKSKQEAKWLNDINQKKAALFKLNKSISEIKADGAKKENLLLKINSLEEMISNLGPEQFTLKLKQKEQLQQLLELMKRRQELIAQVFYKT